jgi:tetratricopeptide (TPR) repeat protein
MNILKFANLSAKASICLLMTVASIVICSAQKTDRQSVFFMRYEPPNIETLGENIEKAFRILDEAKKNRDRELVFQTSVDLGELLTIARREKEALEILEPLIKSDSGKAKPEDRAWLYLNYATANQYFRRNARAAAYFKKALRLVRKHQLESTAGYVLHHYARFLVENGDLRKAERYFEEALKIRDRLQDERVDSTRQALAKLRQLKSASGKN